MLKKLSIFLFLFSLIFYFYSNYIKENDSYLPLNFCADISGAMKNKIFITGKSKTTNLNNYIAEEKLNFKQLNFIEYIYIQLFSNFIEDIIYFYEQNLVEKIIISKNVSFTISSEYEFDVKRIDSRALIQSNFTNLTNEKLKFICITNEKKTEYIIHKSQNDMQVDYFKVKDCNNLIIANNINICYLPYQYMGIDGFILNTEKCNISALIKNSLFSCIFK